MSFSSLMPNIMVEDVSQTLEFYTQILGFEQTSVMPESGPPVWTMVQRDQVQIMFQSRATLTEEYPVFQDQPIGASLTHYMTVDQVDDLHQELKDQVKVIREPHTTFYGRREFAFLDCNGHVLVYSQFVDLPMS